MGQLAAALGVVPGTATTMVKALAESGLVRYEPYAGVRLTKAGEKLAALVLRRHRLVELFLVKVMGMSWTEVHDEAEALEHAVSDRLIDRIDEMLGTARGRSAWRSDSERRGARAPAVLRNAAHLRAERAGPRQPRQRSGPRVPALRRAPRSQAGRDRQRRPSATRRPTACACKGAREFTIGARAASKVLVQAVAALLLVLSIAGRRVGAAERRAGQPAASRSGSPTTPSSSKRRSTRRPGSSRTSSTPRARAATGRRRSRRNGRSSPRSTSSRTRSPWSSARRRRGIRRHAAQLPLPGAG